MARKGSIAELPIRLGKRGGGIVAGVKSCFGCLSPWDIFSKWPRWSLLPRKPRHTDRLACSAAGRSCGLNFRAATFP